MWFLIVSSAMALIAGILASRKSPIPDDGQQGSFGDRMASEGETGNLWVIKGAMYSVLFAYSDAVSIITGCSQWTMIGYYGVGLNAFYFWHRIAHHSRSGPTHQVHMLHHKTYFPPDDFYGDRTNAITSMYECATPTLWDLMTHTDDGSFRWSHEGLLVAMFGAVIMGGKILVRSTYRTLFAAAIMYTAMGVLGTAIHMSYHVRNFQLEPYAWYREMRSLHLIHHLRRANYSIVNTAIDFVYRSLKTTVRRKRTITAIPPAANRQQTGCKIQIL